MDYYHIYHTLSVDQLLDLMGADPEVLAVLLALYFTS